MSDRKLPGLPVGIFSFEQIRTAGKLYVDKTDLLVKMCDSCERVFLSRPRRFGKSLTLSTLAAMFSGKAELFRGLAAESWVAEQARHPNPVLRIDFGLLNNATVAELDTALRDELARIAAKHGVSIVSQTLGGVFKDVIVGLHHRGGPVVVLVDEYDKPVLDHLNDPKLAEEMRQKLRSFYTVIKGCEEYLRFVMLTGISKFTKMGVFSAINNLSDISLDKKFGALCGYTQEELEAYFSGWIDAAAQTMDMSREELLAKLKEYYDGFSFDGITRVYNPFSTLQLFSMGDFRNYWYESASPSFIPEYLKSRHEFSLEKFRHKRVSELFISSREIEQAAPESFLYQAGYLTLEKRQGQMLTLDYPNREVLDSLSAMYAELVYNVNDAGNAGLTLWEAFAANDLELVKRLYNAALASIPYEYFGDAREDFYKAIFLTLLRGAGINSLGELHSSRGRSDVEVLLPDAVYVIEFKTAADESQAETKRSAGDAQISDRGYAEKYAADTRRIVTTTFVIDLEKRQTV
ncbi:MAG: AAA family ATPase [Pyramidobacter sp.]|nr:AAA family ATPase [Pyramidobacter sp.]